VFALLPCASLAKPLLWLYQDDRSLPVGILVLIVATTFQECCTILWSTAQYGTEYGREERILIVVVTRATGKNYNLVLTATTFECKILHCAVQYYRGTRNASSIITAGTEQAMFGGVTIIHGGRRWSDATYCN